MSNAFTSYRLNYFSASQFNWDVHVNLYKDGVLAGRILFIKAGRPLMANVIDAAGVPVIHYPINCFSDVMAILRYEKPLFISVDLSNGLGQIFTTNEPVGEQEPVVP